ncbi:MAG: UDP-N-acetylmuramoyl-L-alanyl-D-glutamate--2,6-diaminopimelate ligase [Anaerolineales bacterium]|nr:UDP-N-acetylmuramoyl-L-alanyl-D-glutamate--2,6-diaminopimelate ligase [Anaerolineales bacterium]
MGDTVHLATLLDDLRRVRDVRGSADVLITGVHHDSRQIEPGNVFVALKGETFDGRRFIPQAVEHGAVAVVFEGELDSAEGNLGEPKEVPFVLVPDAREALAHLAAAFHGYPSRQLKTIGVTGTDGKTTTCNLIHGLLTAAGHRVGLVSTVSARIGDEEIDTGFHVTTPEAQDLQAYLHRMLDRGAEYAVVEATSHGLAQRRVDAVDFDVAVLTNITHESLEYHGTFEAYREAKAQLFRMLGESHRKPSTPKVAILNADDVSFERFSQFPADRELSYAVDAPADLTATGVRATPAGLRFTAHTPSGSFKVESSLLGVYNVYNILAALAVGVSQNLTVEELQAGIAVVRNVPGRMDLVDEGQDFITLVDFAHTAGALENALRAARGLTAERVIVVFGCAGLRDVEKRPMMGEIAARLADFAVITAEDPRTEDLDAIMAQIVRGAEHAGAREGRDFSIGSGHRFVRIADRGAAIRAAVEVAEAGDVVIVAGKGHEQSMCFGTTEYPWSDHVALRKALRGEVYGVLPTASCQRRANNPFTGTRYSVYGFPRVPTT